MTREEIIHLSNTYKTPEDTNILKQFFSDPNNISSQKQTIAFTVVSESGTSHFRCFEPLLALYRKTDEFNLLYCNNGINPFVYNISDIIFDQRASDPSDFFLNVRKYSPLDKRRPIFIHGADDNESVLPKTHGLHEVWKRANRDKQSVRACNDSDYIETTTRKLAQYLGSYNKNVGIIRNAFNWNLPQWNLESKRPLNEFISIEGELKDEFIIPESWEDKIIIGYFGLSSHLQDTAKIAPIFTKIAQLHPNTCFLIGGLPLKDTMFEITQDEHGKDIMKENDKVKTEDTYLYKVKQMMKNIPENRIIFCKALQLEQYGWFSAQTDYQISLTEHNTFNSCKSEIKVIESSRYKNITIYSDFGGYSDMNYIMKNEGKFTSDEINKISCRTECDINEWVSKFSYWINNHQSEERNQLTSKLKDFVSDYYSIDRTINQRIDKYKELIESNIEKEETRIHKMNYELLQES